MKIAMTPGHSSKCPGASDLIDEVTEARRVVNRTAEYLRSMGVEIATWQDDISTEQQECLDRICNWHNDVAFGGGDHDYDISVHFNSSNGTTTKPIGTECWYMTQDDLAADVASAIAEASGLIDRGKKYSDGLAFLRNTREKSILVEVAFVNSSADVALYQQAFDQICAALAQTIGRGDIPEPIPPEPSGVLFAAQGRCSHFGGPADGGVSPSEGLAFIYSYSEAPHLFLPEQPPGTTGLARRLNPNIFYIACRWDYDRTSKELLKYPSRQALVRAHGLEFLAWPADWGPHEDTGRVADLSPGLMDALGVETDDEVEVIYPAP